MLYDFNNFSSTRRNLLLLNLILILSLFSVEKISILNLYFFKIDLSKLPLDFSDIIFIVTIYFFIVYCSFLLNNENNAIEIFKRTYFFKLRKKTNIFLLIIITPIWFIIDMMRVKYFAIISTPYIISYISIYIYLYQKIPSFGLIIVLFLFGAMPNIFSGFLDILELKYEQDINKILIKKTKDNLKEKYRINKKNILSKRK